VSNEDEPTQDDYGYQARFTLPAELQALIKGAEAQMQSAKKNHIQEVRTKSKGLLMGAGLTIDEVYPIEHFGRTRAALLPDPTTRG